MPPKFPALSPSAPPLEIPRRRAGSRSSRSDDVLGKGRGYFDSEDHQFLLPPHLSSHWVSFPRWTSWVRQYRP